MYSSHSATRLRNASSFALLMLMSSLLSLLLTSTIIASVANASATVLSLLSACEATTLRGLDFFPFALIIPTRPDVCKGEKD